MFTSKITSGLCIPGPKGSTRQYVSLTPYVVSGQYRVGLEAPINIRDPGFKSRTKKPKPTALELRKIVLDHMARGSRIPWPYLDPQSRRKYMFLRGAAELKKKDAGHRGTWWFLCSGASAPENANKSRIGILGFGGLVQTGESLALGP
ncbi:hypothetical protein HYALB_00001184 [Hymenoscyphus albidus]|uniref:Uncharacterized protein n=1 Tax=Hymenoscyphus albidus TaxID=595503 RepID=A0A9N9PRI9_9HELO|nr:hypothetical protein HYALB_00001184 [Hymenoscyphus albidus]